MQSILTLEVIRSEHPGDHEPRTWTTTHPPSPPPGRRRLRRGAAQRLAGLATRLHGDGARPPAARRPPPAPRAGAPRAGGRWFAGAASAAASLFPMHADAAPTPFAP